MFLDFIEKLYFECEIQKDNKIGISIDAVQYYIDKLPLKKNCKKIHCAISDFNGFLNVYYLSDSIIKKYRLPWWVRGCNSINEYHPTVKNLLKNMNIDIKDVVSIDSVPYDFDPHLLRIMT